MGVGPPVAWTLRRRAEDLLACGHPGFEHDELLGASGGHRWRAVLADRGIAEAVQRGGAVDAKRFDVFGREVALVAGEAVLWEDAVPFGEAGVAFDFRENGGGGDGAAADVAADEGELGRGKVECEGVDEEIVAGRVQLFHGKLHGEAGGLVNIDAVDFEGVDGGDSPGDGTLANERGEGFAALGSELFAVAEAADGAARGENDGGGVDGTEQRTAADFIDAGDGTIAERGGLTFEESTAGWRGRHRAVRLFALAQARGFALQAAQVVELGAADAAGADDVDVIDDGRVNREDALDAVAEADLADGDGFAEAAGVIAGEYGAFKRLEALFIAFLDFDVDANGIAGAKFGDVGALIRGDDFGHDRSLHGESSGKTKVAKILL